ncbi:unnamed protein product [Polarella glacialis]|uniref:Uncharacterized protein n=1 Tax=Polarella glacialis TaxID=89957 RepID=A0A813D5V7_POLGL|nr:unnamed protein product [Polarella glacialis]
MELQDLRGVPSPRWWPQSSLGASSPLLCVRFACLLLFLLWLLLLLLVSLLASSLLLLLGLLLVDLFGRHIRPNVCDKDQNVRWLGGRGPSLILALLCLLCFVCCFLLPVDLRGRHLGPIADEKGTMSPPFSFPIDIFLLSRTTVRRHVAEA